MMEGVCSEAASLAGHLKLNNLCWIYDDNRITIEGETQLAFSEDVARRFEGYGWRVIRAGDVNDLEALRAALREFAAGVGCPTLIIVRSIIGYGAPKKANTAEAHGAPLGAEEVRGAKRAYGWPEDAQFLVPEGVRELFAEGIGRRGAALGGCLVSTLGEVPKAVSGFGWPASSGYSAGNFRRIGTRRFPRSLPTVKGRLPGIALERY